MSLRNMTVLYIEDHKETQEIVSHILKREVKELFIASDGQEGFNIYKEKKPDIVVSDLRLPIMDGIEMTKKIKELNYEQPIIILTAFSDTDTLKSCVDLGIDRFIIKPIIDFEKLLEPLKYISKQIQIKKELKLEQERYKNTFKNASLGITRFSLKGKILEANDKYCQILKFNKDEILDLELKDIIFFDDLKPHLENLEMILKGNIETSKVEKRYIRKDRAIIWVHSSISLVYDEDGNPDYFIEIIEDITKKKFIELELKQAMTVFENTHDGIIITDKDCKIVNVNKAFVKTTGYQKKEVIGKNPNILKSGLHNNQFYKQMYEELNSNKYWTGEIINKTKLGKIYEELLAINVIEVDGKIVNYIGVFSDISVQKEQERILLQQSRTAALGEMISNIAHQWRQPLSVISTASTGLKLLLELNENYDKKEIINSLESINTQTQHLSSTIDDFRDFFKNTAITKDEFDVSQTLKKLKNLIIDSFRSNFIEIHENIEDEIILHQNENLLIQAMINIFNNTKDALKDSSEGDRVFFIEVKKIEDENSVDIILKDNAGGINPVFLKQIFEPYFTTKHASMGTGLGLYMTHKIITKQYNGTVVATNETYEFKNKTHTGAQFRITLPLD